MDQKKRYTIAELFGVEGLYLYGHPGKQELSSGLFCYDLKDNGRLWRSYLIAHTYLIWKSGNAWRQTGV